MLNIQPRETQKTALNLLREHWNSERTFVLYAPVGFGKTAIAAMITDGLIAHKKRILFIAPYTVLIEQTLNRFVQYGINPDDISIIWQKHPAYDPEKLIQIASADTLIRRELPTNIDLIIIDEAHIRRKNLLEYIRDTDAKVIGLSGTPFAAFMGLYYKKLIKPASMRELIELGELSPYEFFAPTKPNLEGVKTQSTSMGNDYNESQLERIMCGADLVGNVVQNWLENGNDLPTICFCVNVKHANYITTRFRKHGINADVMTAKTPADERRQIISRFESGITKIIINVGVLVAGFDSDVRCIIYARPTKSEIRWIQCLGRGLRTAEGKDKCIIFDHSGTVHRLGFPDQIEYDTLRSTDNGLATASQRPTESYEKKPRECSQCHYMKPVGIYECPKCGHKPLACEDIETDETRSIQKITKSKQRKPTHEEKQSWWSQILFYRHNLLQTKNKYLSDGWCAHMYRKKFGVFPRGMTDIIMEISPEVRNFIISQQIAYAKSLEKQAKTSIDASGDTAPQTNTPQQNLAFLVDKIREERRNNQQTQSLGDSL